MPDDGRKRFHNWRIAAWNSFDNSVVHSLWKRLPTGENWNLAQYIGDTTMELYSLDINEIFSLLLYYHLVPIWSSQSRSITHKLLTRAGPNKAPSYWLWRFETTCKHLVGKKINFICLLLVMPQDLLGFVVRGPKNPVREN